MHSIEEGAQAGLLDLQNEQYHIKKQLLDLERAHRACNLKLSGLPTPPDEATISQKRDAMVQASLDRVQRTGIRGITQDDIQMARVIKVLGQAGLVLQICLVNEAIKDRIIQQEDIIQDVLCQ